MTDITKCTGEGCSLKETCWRYLAPFNDRWQSMMSPPQNVDKCEFYWEKKRETTSENNALQIQRQT